MLKVLQKAWNVIDIIETIDSLTSDTKSGYIDITINDKWSQL